MHARLDRNGRSTKCRRNRHRERAASRALPCFLKSQNLSNSHEEYQTPSKSFLLTGALALLLVNKQSKLPQRRVSWQRSGCCLALEGSMHSALSNLSAAELVGKGIAPVKREYWKPPASRQEVAAVGSSEAAATAAPPERKSKRQAKRVSIKRALHLLLLQTLLQLLLWSTQGHCSYRMWP